MTRTVYLNLIISSLAVCLKASVSAPMAMALKVQVLTLRVDALALRFWPSLRHCGAVVRYSRVDCPSRHIIGHFGDDFTGQMGTNYHWRTVVIVNQVKGQSQHAPLIKKVR